jgi:hypothetical protein
VSLLVPGGLEAKLITLKAQLSATLTSTPLHCLSLQQRNWILQLDSSHGRYKGLNRLYRMTRIRKPQSSRRKLSPLLLFVLASSVAASQDFHVDLPGELLQRAVSPRASATIPLKITNNCAETVWPGIASQSGTGPGTGGFELKSGTSKTLATGEDWQGRVWGRTNCSFNAAGTGASNLNGNNGAGRACGTGDCNGVLSCVVTVCFP